MHKHTIARAAAVAAFGATLLTATAAPALADTPSGPSIQAAKTSPNDLLVAVPGYDISVDGLGGASATNIATGATEALPTSATGADGTPVTVQYSVEGSALRVHAVATPTATDPLAESKGIGKCLSGIAGGAVTGGTTLGLAGASVGTVTLPLVGTVGGGLVGAIGGAVGGGLTGGATFC